MKKIKQQKNLFILAGLLVSLWSAQAEIRVVTGRNSPADSTPDFEFRRVPSPAKTGTAAKFTIVDGELDGNSGGLNVLHDGRVPTEEDDPEANFFFAAGTPGGRLLMDLNQVKNIQQINTYSWHGGSRAPQVYRVFASTGTNSGFNSSPKIGIDPASCGWTLLASVDTRRTNREPGGQHGVSIRDAAGAVGDYRYLLFDCKATETNDAFGNTFYSEIEALTAAEVAAAESAAETNTAHIKPFVARTADGQFEITINTSRAADLTEWATNKLAPALVEWYPKIVALLPSDGFEAPKKFTVRIRPGRGVADTSGTNVNAYTAWIKRELHGQAIGSVVHEAVHVVQQYGYGREKNPHPAENPGYLVEGLADYVRWYLYEPQSKGAEISERGLARAKFDGSYRVTANFLNWVTEHYDKGFVAKLNAAMREGNYSTNIWQKATGKSIEDLNTEWKEDLKKKIDAAAEKRKKEGT